MILRNEMPKAWALLKGMKGGRVDFVLDNGASYAPSCSDRVRSCKLT